MNTIQLKTFLTLADCLNVTETADRMHCTQPAVSARIRGLEDECKAHLFDRIGKRMHMTSQGAVFREYARQVLSTLQAATEHLHQMDDPLWGTIHFGASNFIGTYLIPPFLGRYRKQAPKVLFELDISPSTELINRLETNKVEFLILSDQIPLNESRFSIRPLCEDEMVLVAPPTHPLARGVRCTLHDLETDTFLLKAPPSATHSFILERIHAMGGSLGPQMHISSTEAIKQGVMNGLGISILSRFTVKHEIEAGRLCEVPIQSARFKRRIQIVSRAGKLLSPAAVRFLETLKRCTQTTAAAPDGSC